MNADREAARLADIILWHLKQSRRNDWSTVAAIIGDKLRGAAWNHSTRAMLADHHHPKGKKCKALCP